MCLRATFESDKKRANNRIRRRRGSWTLSCCGTFVWIFRRWLPCPLQNELEVKKMINFISFCHVFLSAPPRLAEKGVKSEANVQSDDNFDANYFNERKLIKSTEHHHPGQLSGLGLDRALCRSSSLPPEQLIVGIIWVLPSIFASLLVARFSSERVVEAKLKKKTMKKRAENKKTLADCVQCFCRKAEQTPGPRGERKGIDINFVCWW